jgi:hypothetical protein
VKVSQNHFDRIKKNSEVHLKSLHLDGFTRFHAKGWGWRTLVVAMQRGGSRVVGEASYPIPSSSRFCFLRIVFEFGDENENRQKQDMKNGILDRK